MDVVLSFMVGVLVGETFFFALSMMVLHRNLFGSYIVKWNNLPLTKTFCEKHNIELEWLKK